tara:strand:- start:3327 stop:3911 length:585 start_codon:yes stop_codon:yes gene_type:complete
MNSELKFPLPFMLKDEFQLFSEIVKPVKYYFEFGSGGSTSYVGEHTDAHIYTADSDKKWLDKIKAYLGSRGDIIYKHVDIGPIGEFGMPLDESQKRLWPNYSNSLEDSGFEPDLVLVDGRFRVACILKTIRYALDKKLNPRIMVHDCDRKQYHIAYKYLNKIERSSKLCVFEIKRNTNSEEINPLIAEAEFHKD